MRRIRAVWDRERTSVKSKTAACCFTAGLGPRLALKPPQDQPTPAATATPSCRPEGWVGRPEPGTSAVETCALGDRRGDKPREEPPWS